MSALNGLAKTGGSVNKVIPRNGSRGCYAGSRARNYTSQSWHNSGETATVRTEQLSARFSCVSLASRTWESGTGTRPWRAIWRSLQRFRWMPTSLSSLSTRSFLLAFSVPWWTMAILFLGLNSRSQGREPGRASLNWLPTLGSISLTGGRVTLYQSGYWKLTCSNERVLYKGRVIIHWEGVSQTSRWMTVILWRIRDPYLRNE